MIFDIGLSFKCGISKINYVYRMGICNIENLRKLLQNNNKIIQQTKYHQTLQKKETSPKELNDATKTVNNTEQIISNTNNK